MDKIDNLRISDILDRYMDRTATPEEEQAAIKWLQDHAADPSCDKEFERLLSNTTPDHDFRSMERSYGKIMRFIDDEQAREMKSRRRRRLFRWVNAGIAAAAAATILYISRTEEPVEWNEIYAERGKTEKLMLPDGTSLWLNSGTKVIYPSRFDTDERSIYIDGEVYADVTSDKKKPFIVSAKDIRVKVHGTRFSVKAFAEMENIEVALLCGSVTVEDCNDENGFARTLKPGELIRYNKEYGTLEEYHIDPDTYGEWQNNHNMRFINQSLEEIAEYLERKFKVEILIEDETLAKTQYYASFVNNEGLDKILNALNSNGIMKISKRHDTIVISPNN